MQYRLGLSSLEIEENTLLAEHELAFFDSNFVDNFDIVDELSEVFVFLLCVRACAYVCVCPNLCTSM